MAVPKQLKEQTAKGEELARRIAGEEPNPAPQPDPAAGGDNPPPTPEPAAEPATDPTPEPAAEPAPEPELTLEQRLAKVEASYSSLQGKYNAEIRRALETVQQLTEENAQLRKQLTDTPPAAPATAPAGDLPVTLTAEQHEALGDDLAGIIESYGKMLMQAVLEKNVAKTRAIEGKIHELNQMRFFEELTREVPDWKTVNVDRGFCKWLEQVDPKSRMINHAMLTAAFNDLDVQTVAAFFKDYKALQQIASPPAPVAPAATGQRPAVPSRLAPHLSPPRSAGGAPPAGQPKIWTATEMRQVRDDINKGRIKPEEARRLIKEMETAVSAGKYRLD